MLNEREKPCLVLYWEEVRPGEEHAAASSQVEWSIHRLMSLRDVLSDTMRGKRIDARIRRLTLVLESYLHHAFELRERVIQTLALATGEPKDAQRTRHPRQRAAALERLAPKAPVLVDRVRKLFAILDSDVQLRNLHTHEQFLSLGLFAGGTMYDPEDMLQDGGQDPQKATVISQLLSAPMRKLRTDYLCMIDAVCEAAWCVADAADHQLPICTEPEPPTEASRLPPP